MAKRGKNKKQRQRVTQANLISSNSFNDLTEQEKNLIRAERKRQIRQQNESFRKLVAFDGVNTSSDVMSIAPTYFIPQLENASLELPKHRAEILSWCDYYCQTNEIAGAAIDIHAAMSVSDLAITCSDKAIEREYNTIYEEMGGIDLMHSIAHEFYRVGNVFPWGNWDEEEQTWKEFVLVPPTAVELKKVILKADPNIYLKYDALQKSLTDYGPTAVTQDQSNVSSLLLGVEQQGQNIPLPEHQISHISNRIIAGTLWGVPPLFRCFKSLILYDKMYRSRQAILEDLIIPLRIFQITDASGAPVQDEVLDAFREQLENAQADPNYKIVTSGQVIDRQVGVSGRVQDYSRELEFLEDMIAAGMKINKAVLHGEGPTYANAQVYQQTMAIQYQVFRTRLSHWLRNKVFKKIAETRGYYEKDNSNEISGLSVSRKTKRLMLPNIIWRNDISFDQAMLQTIENLFEKGLISRETYLSYVAPYVDIDDEAVKLAEQSKQDAVREEVAPEVQEDIEGAEGNGEPKPKGTSSVLPFNVERRPQAQ